MGNNLMQTDLSVWGMYHHADIVVKIVMIGLILASVVTWAIFFSKSAELLSQKRRLKREQQQLAEARSLDQASDMTSSFHAKSLTTLLVNEAQNELELSAGSEDNEGIKERTGFRLERRVAAVGRHMGRGNGYLATIGAISPFIGLFGTVWGIMNSFIGIAQTQTTNLAVVAPGITEAPLATVDVKVNLTASSSQPQPRPEKPVYLSVKADKSMFLGNDPVTADSVIPALDQLTGGKKDTTVFFRADKTVDYETMMKVMDTLHQAGYLKIGLVGEEKAAAK